MIGFESEDVYVRRPRERLQAMDDEELIRFGKYARSFAGIRVSGLPAVQDSIRRRAEGAAQTSFEAVVKALTSLTFACKVLFLSRVKDVPVRPFWRVCTLRVWVAIARASRLTVL